MQQTIWVTNERLGDGVIIAIIDYGVHHNSVLMVGFESGEIKFLDTNQVKLTRNDTLGIGNTRDKKIAEAIAFHRALKSDETPGL
jgi:hypothetical protein